jgi:hypothetical protein
LEGAPKAVIDVVGTAYSDERSSPDTWLSEVPPTGVLTRVLGEMAFCYEACWLHYVRRSAGEDAMSTPEEVLSYWFPEGINDADPQTRRRQAERWMAGGPEVDREITERFGETLEQARRGELDHWAETARGRLALIVVLDQFSRNVYRGSPLSYAQDEKALRLADRRHRLGDGPRAGCHGAVVLLASPGTL